MFGVSRLFESGFNQFLDMHHHYTANQLNKHCISTYTQYYRLVTFNPTQYYMKLVWICNNHLNHTRIIVCNIYLFVYVSSLAMNQITKIGVKYSIFYKYIIYLIK